MMHDGMPALFMHTRHPGNMCHRIRRQRRDSRQETRIPARVARQVGKWGHCQSKAVVRLLVPRYEESALADVG